VLPYSPNGTQKKEEKSNKHEETGDHAWIDELLISAADEILEKIHLIVLRVIQSQKIYSKIEVNEYASVK